MSAAPVEPLMKVRVAWDDPPRSGRVEFVVGVGPGGLVPFEHLLSGRTAGDEVRFTLASAEEAGRFFGHLAPAFGPWFKAGEVACVVRIDAVERPDPREVVRALAEATGHGPCDCGCGCGGSNERNPFS